MTMSKMFDLLIISYHLPANWFFGCWRSIRSKKINVSKKNVPFYHFSQTSCVNKLWSQWNGNQHQKEKLKGKVRVSGAHVMSRQIRITSEPALILPLLVNPSTVQNVSYFTFKKLVKLTANYKNLFWPQQITKFKHILTRSFNYWDSKAGSTVWWHRQKHVQTWEQSQFRWRRVSQHI